MIYIRSKDLWDTVKVCYQAIERAELSLDPDIYKEDTGILIFEAGYKDPSLIDETGDELKCAFNKELYFPGHHSLKLEAEDAYWNEKLIRDGLLDKMIEHLSSFPNSRSCIYNFWDNSDFTSANPKGNCITQIYFRTRGGRLDMHAHIRANDVHRCLLMDLAYLLYAHDHIARNLGTAKGEYVHIVDSLHYYKKSRTEFDEQLSYIQKADSPWAKL